MTKRNRNYPKNCMVAEVGFRLKIKESKKKYKTEGTKEYQNKTGSGMRSKLIILASTLRYKMP